MLKCPALENCDVRIRCFPDFRKDQLCIELSRRIDSNPITCRYIITCEMLGMTEKDFQIIKDVLSNVCDDLSLGLAKFISKKFQ